MADLINLSEWRSQREANMMPTPDAPISSAEFAEVARQADTLRLALDGLSRTYRLPAPSRLPVQLVIWSDESHNRVVTDPATRLAKPTRVGVPLSFPQALLDHTFLERQEAMELAATYGYVIGTLSDGITQRQKEHRLRPINRGFNPAAWEPREAFLANMCVVPHRVAAAVALPACGLTPPLLLGKVHQPPQLAAMQNPAYHSDVQIFALDIQASLERSYPA
jgi:hypothetical protein